MELHPLSSMMGTSLEKIREMIDVNTIIGDAITTPDGTVIIPVSKVSLGFASGGTDFSGKAPEKNFGGGSGAGITISPIAFIVVGNGDVRLIQVSAGDGAGDKLANIVPEMFDKIVALFSKKDKEKENKNKEDKEP